MHNHLKGIANQHLFDRGGGKSEETGEGGQGGRAGREGRSGEARHKKRQKTARARACMSSGFRV